MPWRSSRATTIRLTKDLTFKIMSYTVKEQRELIQAYEQGEEMEWRSINVAEWSPLPPKGQFKEVGYDEPLFDFINNYYRVKPKRWRAENGGRYYYVNASGVVMYSTDGYLRTDNRRYDFGNYFQTEVQAEEARELIQECLIKLHENDNR